ncbi:putative spermidine/putrescine transport system ATP-binding protein [Kitasatospora sp. GAS204A]|uniref:ABC transporter ATP-binding protein n=1 Tax=unclassified Kitasatospora TaxID=2633591 RepID=UPI00247375BD|nr:ABC transporter ATP-binding protein [Kitasatospora sp. GAS204B]MDH6121403.1 putative spermidine/putrescine transport system ATP-binding protein [Kitasatospora sp. GAS204B]
MTRSPSPRPPTPGAVALSGVSKAFGAVRAVDGIDLEVRPGEFFSMLGPSGSGKTTVLRMIAGFEAPSAGRVLLGGIDVTRLAAFDRDVNTVFQDYALFPHLSVRQNIEYGLKVKRVPRAERAERAAEALATVRLHSFGDRRPAELSGGQRQRVALARALVNRPSVLLLDEPLGALDLKLRQEMQLELKQIQREAGITFVLVTHDQDEALTMSDRIAVFNAGRIEQVGTPAEVYERPATAFVAGFVGTSNLLQGPCAVQVFGESGTYSVRPEKIRVAHPDDPTGPDEHAVTGTIGEVVYAGAQTRFLVDLEAGGQLVAVRQNFEESGADAARHRGSAVLLAWQRQHTVRINP